MRESGNGDSLRAYLEGLASSRPAPGGGSAAALAGALASALDSMVASISARKTPELASLGDKARTMMNDLLFLMDEDTRAFLDLMEAYRAKDEMRIRQCAQDAATVPLQTSEKALQAMVLGMELFEKGNPRVATDAIGAIYLGWSAVQSALLNVYINLPSVGPGPERDHIQSRAEAYARKADELLAESRGPIASFVTRTLAQMNP
ncbi:MAG: cyclodeaminase/cyclohydrolase family protein [bacterium JZ-2024 1]